jgi:hypothetical protein
MGAYCRLLLLEATQIIGSLLEKGADINAAWGAHGTVLEITTIPRRGAKFQTFCNQEPE